MCLDSLTSLETNPQMPLSTYISAHISMNTYPATVSRVQPPLPQEQLDYQIQKLELWIVRHRVFKLVDLRQSTKLVKHNIDIDSSLNMHCLDHRHFGVGDNFQVLVHVRVLFQNIGDVADEITSLDFWLLDQHVNIAVGQIETRGKGTEYAQHGVG